MAGRKKGSGRAAANKAPAASADRAASGKSTLLGSVFHGGRMYSSKRKGDADALQKALDKETDPARKKANAEAMQNLANKGKVTGFGTSAAKAKVGKGKAKGRAEAEAEGELEPGDPDAEAGGGVEATEDPNATEEE